jgi:hypothetical protein
VKRWFIYAIIGIVFGVFDFYYQGFIYIPFKSTFLLEIIRLVLVIGIWLVPIVPVVIYEAKVSRTKVLSALASSLIWCVSIISYYLTNVVQLAFLGLPTRPEMHISNYSEPSFWVNWKNVFLGEILGGIVEWAVVAVVCGFIVGFLVSFIYLFLKKTRLSY